MRTTALLPGPSEAGRMEPPARAREYYRALDDDDYAALGDLLAPAFVQERPDMTLEGRERFVRFMREKRPQSDTTHAVDAVYHRGPADTVDAGDGPVELAVRGRLLDADGDLLARFVDVFVVGADGVDRLDTFTQ